MQMYLIYNRIKNILWFFYNYFRVDGQTNFVQGTVVCLIPFIPFSILTILCIPLDFKIEAMITER